MKKIFLISLFYMLLEQNFCQTIARSSIKSTPEKNKREINLGDLEKLISESCQTKINIGLINSHNIFSKKNTRAVKADSNMNNIIIAAPFNGGVISMPFDKPERYFKGISIPTALRSVRPQDSGQPEMDPELVPRTR